MAFPIRPADGESETQFLVQDPFQLRKQVLPLLTVDKADGFLSGLGTSFLADPFGTFLTAEHVLKEHFETPALREGAVAAALFGMRLVFGTVGLRSEYFAPISDIQFWRRSREEQNPLFGPASPPRIVADAVGFHVDATKVPGSKFAPPMPLRLSGARPQVGDRVMALGYPELTCLRHDSPDRALIFTERMYGAVGTVRSLLPHGRGSMYPWPLIEVEAHWRSGMSGGPVINEAGEVIGLVSFSLEPDDGLPGVGFATDLAGIGIDRLVPTLDPLNSGFYRCHGVLRSAPWHLSGVFPDREQAEEHLATLGPGYEVRFGSHRFGSDDFVSVLSTHNGHA